MKIKSTSAPASGRNPFGELPTKSPSSPTSQTLAKEAKKANNLEKGKAADEKFLGEEQNVDTRYKKMVEITRLAEAGLLTLPEDHPPWCECPACAGAI